MARIAGVELPRNKRMEIALTYVFGIGRKSALDICAAAEIEPGRKTDEVTDEVVEVESDVHDREALDLR